MIRHCNSAHITSEGTSASNFPGALHNSLTKLSFSKLLLKRCCRPFPCPQKPDAQLQILRITASPQEQKQNEPRQDEPARISFRMSKLKSGSFLAYNPVNWKHSQILYAWMRITHREQKSCLPATLPLSIEKFSACRARNAHEIRWHVYTFASVIRSADSHCKNACARVSWLIH